MGYSPREVDEMSMWQFMAAMEGWMKAMNPEEEEGGRHMSETQASEIWEWMKTKQDVPLSSMRH